MTRLPRPTASCGCSWATCAVTAADEAAIGHAYAAPGARCALACDGLAETIPILQEISRARKASPELVRDAVHASEILPRAATARVIRAGHPAPIVINGDEVSGFDDSEVTRRSAWALGGWSERVFDLPSELALLLYTDGIIEGRVGAGSARLGEAGLHRLVAEWIRRRPACGAKIPCAA